MVPPLVAAAAGVTLITVGAANLPSALLDGSSSPPTVTGADTDAVARAAAADRGSRSGARAASADTEAMSLSEAAEAVTEEQQRLAEAQEAEEAAREERAARAGAEARRTRWVSPLDEDTYELMGPEDEGVGLAAESGTPVHAIGTGTIRYAGADDEYGQMIVIEHWDGTLTYYCYLSSFEKTEGEVAVDELIGRVGNTGTTSASHLHLQIRPRGGDPVDPLQWLEKRGVEL